MKKRFFTVATIVAVSGSLLFSSCIGSFAMSNKLLAWNKTLADNNFVNAIVFFLLTPVYAITLTVGDALVLNTIEFWTGDNPMEAGVIKQVKGEDGTIYTVETLENGYRIENEAGKEMQLIYDKESNTWSSVSEGITTKLIKIEKDSKAIVYLPNGNEMNVDLSAEGVLAVRDAVQSSTYYAVR